MHKTTRKLMFSTAKWTAFSIAASAAGGACNSDGGGEDTGELGVASAPLVDGGVFAVPDEFLHPQIVTIRYTGVEHSCTGVLVASNMILTAAHCTNSNYSDDSLPYEFDPDPSKYLITFVNVPSADPPSATNVYGLRRVFSALNPDGPAGGTSFTAVAVQTYPFYSGTQDVQNDLALLRLPISIPRGFIRPLGVAPSLSQAQLEGYRAELVSAGPGPGGCGDPTGFVQRLVGLAQEGENAGELLWSGYNNGINETSRLCRGDSGAPVLTNESFNNDIGLLDNVVVSVASVIDPEETGAIFYGPLIRPLTREWLRLSALDQDFDGIEAYLDSCDLVPGPQPDSDNDGSGDACDPCPFDPVPPSTDPLENAAFANVDNDWLLDCLDPCRELNDEFLPAENSFNNLDPAIEDTDSDGILDCADPCVLLGGGDGDPDGDGICSTADQCPNAFDAVNRNSNYLAEYGATNSGAFPNTKGDACEPVPVPDFSAQTEFLDPGTLIDCPILATTEEDCLALDPAQAGCCNLDPDSGFTVQLLCQSALRTELEIWPTRSNHPTIAGEKRNVPNLEILPRFCVRSGVLSRSCTSRINGELEEPSVRGADCYEGCANDEAQSTVYKRVTFQQPGPTTPDQIRSTTYNKTLRNGNPIIWNWNAQADFNRLAIAGFLPPDVVSTEEFIGNLALWNDSELGGLNDPDGAAWEHQSDIAIRFHAANYMPVGKFDVESKFPDADDEEGILGPATYQPIDSEVCVACVRLPATVAVGNIQEPQGASAQSSASNTANANGGNSDSNENQALLDGSVDPAIFENGPAPSEDGIAGAASALAIDALRKPYFIWRVGEQRVAGGYEGEGQDAHEAALVFDGLGIPSVLRPGRDDCNGDQATGRFDASMLTLFRAGYRWANAAEPSDAIGGGALAIGFEETGRGTDVRASVVTDYVRLYGDLRSVDVGGAGTPPPTLGAELVYSRLNEMVFVLGGTDPMTARPRGRIWQRRLVDESFQGVQSAYRPVKVLTATYNFRDDNLYFLDEREIVSSSGARQLQVHLVRLDWRAGESTLLRRWVRTPTWDQQHLSVDLNGHLLLASGSSRLKQHAIARLNVSGPVSCEGRLTGVDSILKPVVVDPSGFTIVLHNNETDLLEGVRYRKLPLSSASLKKLAKQL